MEEYSYESSWRRLVKIFVLVLVSYWLGKVMYFGGIETGATMYQYTAATYGTDIADQWLAKYEKDILDW